MVAKLRNKTYAGVGECRYLGAKIQIFLQCLYYWL